MIDNEKQFLETLPNKPGVYQMYDANQHILYVGKAKNLKKRVSSYFRAVDHPKTKIFMTQVKNIEIIITPSENAALLSRSKAAFSLGVIIISIFFTCVIKILVLG